MSADAEQNEPERTMPSRRIIVAARDEAVERDPYTVAAMLRSYADTLEALARDHPNPNWPTKKKRKDREPDVESDYWG